MAYTTIDKPSDYFNTKLYTGNGSTGHAITGVGFQPDWVWIKSRDSGSDNHNAFDVVRGASKGLQPNDTDAEYTASSVHESFNTDGFTLGDNGQVNGSSESFVSWNWKAGGSASTNTSGSTNTSVSVNTDAGFSIVTYPGNSTSGATFGHGLGVKPSMIITKARTRLSMWNVYHKGLTNYTKGIYLNATDAEFAGGAFEAGEPNANTFTLTNGTHVNGSGETYVAYCFAEKKGYSKFGSYTGNGNADGTFVYTGFKPAFVMQKSTTTTYGWQIYDNKRGGFNPENDELVANLDSAETDGSGNGFPDFYSNGFKLRNTDINKNASGVTYIYMAFAENPFVTSTGVPATAR
mgnify:CR=1 FL=1